jgi:tungstate transport system ATP-binding protein
MSAILEARKIVVRYGVRTVLNVDHVLLGEGEVLALIGPNGAGKSTLLRVLGGLERPTLGTLAFRGEPIEWRSRLLPFRRRIATLFAESHLADTTVEANVALGCRFRRLPPEEVRRRSRRWMERLSIDHLAHRQARGLSSGEAQRVSLARALAIAPEVLLLDEPFSSLDQPTREGLLLTLDAILRSERISAIFATHDRTEALLLGHRLAVMMGGAILQVARPDQILRAPASSEVARFVGAETIVHGVVLNQDQGLLTVEAGGHKLTIAGEAKVGEAVHLCFRPEDFTLSGRETSSPTSSARNHLNGRVTHLAPLGPLVRVTVDCGLPLIATVTRASAEELGLKEGAPVIVTFKASSPHLLRQG